MLILIFDFLPFSRSGNTPFAAERQACHQTEHRRFRSTASAAARRRRGPEETGRGTRPYATAAHRGEPAETAGSRTVVLFAGPKAFRPDHRRLPGQAATGQGRGAAGRRPVSVERRQARVAAHIADPAEPVAQGGGERGVRPDAGPDRVSGNEPGRRDQIGGETQRQLQAGERRQPAAGGQVAEHVVDVAKVPQRKRSR